MIGAGPTGPGHGTMDPRPADLSRRFVDAEPWFTTSPLYRRLCLVVAEDERLLGLAAECRHGQQPANLLLAAVHDLILRHPDEELAAWYASVVGRRARSPATVAVAFRSFCERYRADLLELVRCRLVQTNVVARAAALRLGLAVVGREVGAVTLVEVGASAGVLLRFDRYRYEISGQVFGDPASAVTVRCVWRGDAALPDLDRLPRITRRIGVDLEPLDPTSAEDRRWLEALVWPENRDEAALLDAALRIVGGDPPPMVPGDAVEVLPELDDDLAVDEPLVVFHAATRAHVPGDRRAAFDATIDRMARRRPLYHLALEGPDVLGPRLREPGRFHVLTLERATGRRRQARTLAAVEGHAAWMSGIEV